jgi:hypothetical protein
MPSEAYLENFYRTDYRKRYTGYKKPSHKYIVRLGRDVRARYHADFVLKSGGLKDEITLIDIGAAEGSFLKAMAEMAALLEVAARAGAAAGTAATVATAADTEHVGGSRSSRCRKSNTTTARRARHLDRSRRRHTRTYWCS